MKLLVLAAVLLASSVHGEDGARLLASKSLLNRYAVEGRDLTLQYNMYNVGSSAALEVELSDDSFPPEDFGIVSGMLSVKWDRIAPASNVSHTVVLRPLKAGYFNFTSATITYLAQEGGQVVVSMGGLSRGSAGVYGRSVAHPPVFAAGSLCPWLWGLSRELGATAEFSLGFHRERSLELLTALPLKTQTGGEGKPFLPSPFLPFMGERNRQLSPISGLSLDICPSSPKIWS
uniref:Signal sequence receptor subunit 2 n=1 Tax=Salvator merianae TaxID=96440 RepID=A0A8D0C622_SALMN